MRAAPDPPAGSGQKGMENCPLLGNIRGMASTEGTLPAARVPSVEEILKEWHDLTLRVGQLEVERTGFEQENKTLRAMLETVIEHRQKSHSELIMLLTGLVSKLPINDIGVVVSKLVEHNTNVSQFLASLVKGVAEPAAAQPAVLKTWEQARRDLQAAIKPVVSELLQQDTPFENAL